MDLEQELVAAIKNVTEDSRNVNKHHVMWNLLCQMFQNNVCDTIAKQGMNREFEFVQRKRGGKLSPLFYHFPIGPHEYISRVPDFSFREPHKTSAVLKLGRSNCYRERIAFQFHEDHPESGVMSLKDTVAMIIDHIKLCVYETELQNPQLRVRKVTFVLWDLAMAQHMAHDYLISVQYHTLLWLTQKDGATVDGWKDGQQPVSAETIKEMMLQWDQDRLEKQKPFALDLDLIFGKTKK